MHVRSVSLKHIQDFIKQRNVRFVLQPLRDKSHGCCINPSKPSPRSPVFIVIDPNKEFIPTLIHECIHGIKPKYKEREVLYIERKIMKSIKGFQIIKLLKCFSEHARLLRDMKSIDQDDF